MVSESTKRKKHVNVVDIYIYVFVAAFGMYAAGSIYSMYKTYKMLKG